jgi:glycosyltransferase involved in cell wall biosynthesis
VDFSVIIPCLNSEPYLRRCLGALEGQTYPRDLYEVTLIDNNSTDRSRQIAGEFPRLTVLEEKIQSSYAARNLGARRATGDILVFTDSDCEASPTWLAELASAFEAAGTLLVLGGRRHATESYALSMAADYDEQKVEYICSQPDPRLHYGYTNNLAVRREVFERCGPFVQVLRGGDTLFVNRVVETHGAGAVRHAPRAVLRHLEITRISDWYGKMHTYGGSHRQHRAISHSRALGLQERLEVLRRTVSRHQYPWHRMLSLTALLVIGVVAFELGRFPPRMPGAEPDGKSG